MSRHWNSFVTPPKSLDAPESAVKERHAFLLVLEYRKPAGVADTPNTLLSMNVDLALAYNLAIERFRIPRGNITVVTDLKIQPGVYNPWDPLDKNPNRNPRIIRIAFPDITIIAKEIARFVENTVRGAASKGSKVAPEVFVYISCHGARIPNPMRTEDNDEEYDNALIFLDPTGRSRRYLRDNEIFRLLFGQCPVTDDGMMTIPVTFRETVSQPSTNGSTPQLFYSFGEETISFRVGSSVKNRKLMLTPRQPHDPAKVVGTTPRGHGIYVTDRGLPNTTNMLMIIDACHSGTMTDFHYMFDANSRSMVLTRKPPNTRWSFPKCICLAAANDAEEAPSTSNGSTFTRHIYELLRHLRTTISLVAVYDLIFTHLPKLLEKCRPTITSTSPDINQHLPLLDGDDELELPTWH